MMKGLFICAWLGCILTAAAQSNTWYVWQNSPTNGPGTNWATAFQDIQSAIHAATAGDTVLVTDGVYSTGSSVDVTGVLSNRVVVDKAVTVESVNGASTTEIEGGTGIRCVYMTNGVTLDGFTLTGAEYPTNVPGPVFLGGGAFGGILLNCTLEGNNASWGGGAYGSYLSNCIICSNAAYPPQFGNGAAGGGVFSCTLNDCTLCGNTVLGDGDGGGAFDSVLTRCLVSGNFLDYDLGGGTWESTLYDCVVVNNIGCGVAEGSAYNCVIASNSAFIGGGASDARLFNCVVIGNSATGACGLAGGSAANCIIYDNIGTSDPSSNYLVVAMDYCCTAPLPTNGVGNILGPPGFVDETNGNFMLQSNSPCINAGDNAYVTSSTDLAGYPRIVGGTVDIGAYEYQNPTSIISYAWLQQFGFPTDGSADFLDPDGDGMNNYQEWIAGTNPTNAASVLEMYSVTPTNNPAGLWVTWQSVNTRTYYLQSSTNLGAAPLFNTIQTNISGQSNATSFLDTNATGPGPYFYRVGVSGFP